jgi:PQQ-like domain
MKNDKIVLAILGLAFGWVLVPPSLADGPKLSNAMKSSKLLWQDQISGTANGFESDAVRAVAAKGGQIFVAGEVDNGDAEYPYLYFIVRAYNADTGKLLWQDDGDDGSARAIAVKGGRVFVAGYREGLLFEPHFFTIKAYNAGTGKLLWQDISNEGTGSSIAVNGKRVFVAGNSKTEDTPYHFTVRAYNAYTGKLLWQDKSNQGSASSIVVDGKRIFVAGYIENKDTARDFTVRAYNANTGKLLWQDQVDGTANDSNFTYERAEAIDVSGSRVFVAGELWNEGTRSNFTIRVYNLYTGKLLWQDQVDSANDNWFFDRVRALDVNGSRVFVAGSIGNEGTGGDFTVRAYSIYTGKLLWQDQFDGTANGNDLAQAISVKGSRVFAAGYVENVDTALDFTVRAYNAYTGRLLWQDQFDGTTNDLSYDFDMAEAVDATGRRVFVGGEAWNEGTRSDFTVRAYKW